MPCALCLNLARSRTPSPSRRSASRSVPFENLAAGNRDQAVSCRLWGSPVCRAWPTFHPHFRQSVFAIDLCHPHRDFLSPPARISRRSYSPASQERRGSESHLRKNLYSGCSCSISAGLCPELSRSRLPGSSKASRRPASDYVFPHDESVAKGEWRIRMSGFRDPPGSCVELEIEPLQCGCCRSV